MPFILSFPLTSPVPFKPHLNKNKVNTQHPLTNTTHGCADKMFGLYRIVCRVQFHIYIILILYFFTKLCYFQLRIDNFVHIQKKMLLAQKHNKSRQELTSDSTFLFNSISCSSPFYRLRNICVAAPTPSHPTPPHLFVTLSLFPFHSPLRA